MKSGLWGHALLLASKTDNRTHAQVMLRFANSLPINDPLQTVYQLMSGRQPAAATVSENIGFTLCVRTADAKVNNEAFFHSAYRKKAGATGGHIWR